MEETYFDYNSLMYVPDWKCRDERELYSRPNYCSGYPDCKPRVDVCRILLDLGLPKVQSPNCVSISLIDGYWVFYYPFNIDCDHWGVYQEWLYLKIKKDYDFNLLKALIEKELRPFIS